MEVKTVGVACDHAGFPLKQFVIQYLEAKGYQYKDFGTYSDTSCDYPDFAHPLAEAVENGECYPGIAICGSGEGMAMTLNKHQGIRAGLAWIPEIATMPMFSLCLVVSSTTRQQRRLWTNLSRLLLKADVMREELIKCP